MTDFPPVFTDVWLERARQVEKGFDAAHDDSHSPYSFIQWIKDYASWARMMHSYRNKEKLRKRLIQIAALAIAAVESLDRTGV